MITKTELLIYLVKTIKLQNLQSTSISKFIMLFCNFFLAPYRIHRYNCYAWDEDAFFSYACTSNEISKKKTVINQLEMFSLQSYKPKFEFNLT